MTTVGKTLMEPRVQFLVRHVAAAAAMWVLVGLYLNAFGGLEFHRRDWNRAFANASVVLYAVTLAIGPLARLWRPAAHGLAWRREVGVWATLAAAVHVVIYWEGTYGWSGWRLFFYQGSEAGGAEETLIGGGAFHLANVVGLVALAYAIVLSVTSNDASQRLLKSGWSWLMQRATTMWLLVLLHAWAFAYFIGGMGIVRIGTLWASFFLVLSLQTAAFAKTVWLQRRKPIFERQG